MLRLAALLALWSFSTVAAYAQSSYCQSDVRPASADEIAYQNRGDRCEGLFVQPVSATGLRIAAFHSHPADFDENAFVLNIGTAAASGDKFLTVTSLKRKQRYRMDTRFRKAYFSLPLDLIRHPEISMEAADVAAVICTAHCESATPTLAPASFSGGSPANTFVTLLADLELFELSVKISDGETEEVLFDKEMLGSRAWPAGRPATFPLKPFLEGRESVRFEVVAKGRGQTLIDSIAATLKSE